MAIDVIAGDQAGRNSQRFDRAARLSAAFAAAGATSFHLRTPGGELDRMELIDPALIPQIATGDFFSFPRMPSRTGPVFLAGSGAVMERGLPSWSQRLRQMRQLADRSRALRDDGHALVRVRLELGHAAEDVWLKIVRSKRSANSSDQFIAEMTSASHLWPHLTPGERVRVNAYVPLEVRSVAAEPLEGR